MHDTENLLVSIIIPVFNREELIKETLESVLSQTYENWECLVVDDGSTDNTCTVLEEYTQKDQRFTALSRDRDPKGAPTCRNIGINASNGDYILFLDSDDLLGEECLKFRVEKIRDLPSNTALVFDTSIFRKSLYDDDRMWNKLTTNNEDLVRFLKSDPPWSISGPIWKKGELSFFDETAIAAQDWEFHVRFLLTQKSYLKIPSTSTKTHVHCRRDDVHTSITLSVSSGKQQASISNLVVNVIKELLDSSNSSSSKKEGIYSLLRRAIQQKKIGLKTNALEIWEITKKTNEISKTEYHLWRVYIKFYAKRTKRILDFFAYRIFRKRDVLNNNNGMLK